MRYLIPLILLLALDARANVTNAVAAWTLGPYVGIVGDSIAEGYNQYQTYGNGGPAGDTNFSLGHNLYQYSGGLIGSTNFATPNITWAHVKNTQLPLVLASRPKYVFAHCGINDINTSRTWAAALADMSNILATVTASNATLIINEIFPDSNFTDEQSLTIRQWNTNYAAWAATNNVILLTSHDIMGTNRVSTGYLDDLKYDQGDGVHVSAAGYDVWSTNLLSRLISEGWLYYVSTNGNDTNSGTAAMPWRTVQKSATAMVAGDTVTVRSGTYGTEWIETAANGVTNRPITFQGAGMPVVSGFHVLHPFQVIQGFNIIGTNAGTAVPVHMSIDSSGSIVRSNTFQAAGATKGTFGMDPYDQANRPSNIVFAYNLCLDSAQNALNIQGQRHLIYSNRFEKTANLVPGTSSDGDLLVLTASNVRFFGNYITNWNRPSVEAHCDLIQSFSNAGQIATNNVIELNTFANCVGTQFGNVTDDGSASRVAFWTWRNNVYIDVEAQMSLTAPNCDFFNNTFYRVGTTGVGPILFRTNSPSQGAAHNARVYNNIFVECGGATSTGTGWWGFVGAPTNFVSGGNLVIGTGDGTTKIGFTNGINGQNPIFANAATHDFRLQVTSPAIGAGTNLNSYFTTDIRGLDRGSVWDIGAYEFEEGQEGPPGATGTRIAGKTKINGRTRIN